ncbi:hypothetical protein [Neptunicoccus sediminis]|uniref:hypothetical protein n=1 Tax=Neptunicoccus sediminis TaxID=1892596 RepID=UPI000845F72D|nr:hypothetical protein [Neptunicoccus sediminis]
MTKIENVDVHALPLALREARAAVAELRQRIIRDLSEKSPNAEPMTTAQLLALVREYSTAVLHVTSLEAHIEKHSSAIRGVVQGDAVNLEDARREVLNRLARFRQRSGD